MAQGEHSRLIYNLTSLKCREAPEAAAGAARHASVVKSSANASGLDSAPKERTARWLGPGRLEVCGRKTTGNRQCSNVLFVRQKAEKSAHPGLSAPVDVLE